MYGSVHPQDYLIGNFTPEHNSLFSSVSSFSVPVGTNDTLYIRKEAGTHPMHSAACYLCCIVIFAKRTDDPG